MNLGSEKLLYEFEQRIQSRRPHLDRMRRVAMRQRARVTLDVLIALYIGRVDVNTVPNDPVADRLMSLLTRTYLDPLIRTAVEDFLIAGAGGISITRIGIGQLRPDSWVVFPSFKEATISMRRFEMPLDKACLLFSPQPFEEELQPVLEYLETKKQEIQKAAPWESKTDESIQANQDENQSEEQETNQNEIIDLIQELFELPQGEWNESTLQVFTALEPLLFESLPRLEIIEVITETEILYYYKGNLILRTERLPWEKHLFIVGNERYDVPGRLRRQIDLPISVLETTIRMQANELNLFEAHSRLLESIVKRALRSGVIAYRADLVDEKSRAMREFIEVFHPIATSGQGTPIMPIDQVSMQELLIALREVENMITSLTGVTPYMLAQVGISQTATETLTMQSMSNIKASYIQLQILYWMDQVLESFRSYLTALPHAEQPTVSFFEQLPEDNKMYEFVFGAEGIPYRQALGTVRVGLTSLGFQEHLARRQEIQSLLSFIVGLYQLLVQQGAIYDIPKLVDQFISTYGFDPSEFRIPLNNNPMPQGAETQESSLVSESEATPYANSLPLPETEPAFQTRGTPNPQYAQLNAIMGLLNRIQESQGDNPSVQLERLAAALGGISKLSQ